MNESLPRNDMNSERLLFIRNEELEQTAIIIQETITLDDKINSILCSSEMRLFDDVFMFSTAVLLAAISC